MGIDYREQSVNCVEPMALNLIGSPSRQHAGVLSSVDKLKQRTRMWYYNSCTQREACEQVQNSNVPFASHCVPRSLQAAEPARIRIA